jgi:dienelactone hydrolase
MDNATALSLFVGLLLLLGSARRVSAQSVAVGPAADFSGFTNYFKAETARLSTTSQSDLHSLAGWEARRPELRREAAEMLGLDPLPERTPLHAVITGKLEEKDFTVEKLCFQSQPRLYITANLYLPKPLSNPAPAVLYLCGHLPVITNGVSYGNKTAYQQHGIWFARNGLVCLVMDTLQYGEIPGHHRGTYDEGMWWWNSRGYTPAGVETWDAIRALDYLASRPEVDTNRLGVTGRSGGGAYSWFLAAVDDRVKVIAPVAGITDLQNYAVDGAVDEHCDCMFLINTYRWDYPLLAALSAPRPLLLANSDADAFFPLDGVMRTRNVLKRVYDFYGASTNFGLVIAPGPHKDIQDLQVPVFRWFNHYLKQEDPLIGMAAMKMFAPAELKVLDKIPGDQINTVIQDSFVPLARPPEIPATAQAWKELQETWTNGLRNKCFAGWPAEAGPPEVSRLASEKAGGIQYEVYEIQSQANVALRMYLARKAGDGPPRRIFLRVADSSLTNEPLELADDPSRLVLQIKSVFGTDEAVDALAQEITNQNFAQAVFLPRAVGTAWDPAQLTGLRRRFMLIGQTLDGMRVWDICRAVEAVRSLKDFREIPLCLEAQKDMGVNALYASLFAPGVNSLRVEHIPSRQVDGPDYLNVLKILDIPQAAAMAAARCPLQLQSDQPGWDFLHRMSASPVADLKVEWLR